MHDWLPLKFIRLPLSIEASNDMHMMTIASGMLFAGEAALCNRDHKIL